MIVNKLGIGEYAPLSLQGKRLTIGAEVVDLETSQADSQRIITIKDGSAFVAVIEIPPRSYHSEPISAVAAEETAVIQLVAEDLDTEAVRVTLWPVAKINKEGE